MRVLYISVFVISASAAGFSLGRLTAEPERDFLPRAATIDLSKNESETAMPRRASPNEIDAPGVDVVSLMQSEVAKRDKLINEQAEEILELKGQLSKRKALDEFTADTVSGLSVAELEAIKRLQSIPEETRRRREADRLRAMKESMRTNRPADLPAFSDDDRNSSIPAELVESKVLDPAHLEEAISRIRRFLDSPEWNGLRNPNDTSVFNATVDRLRERHPHVFYLRRVFRLL